MNYTPIPHLVPPNDANRLGLDYRLEASRLPYPAHPIARPIIDAHVHLSGSDATLRYFHIAARFGIREAWSQTPLEEVPALRRIAAQSNARIHFVAVPNYAARHRDDTFTTDWLRRIERFAEQGAILAKFWAAPRGRDYHPSFHLDHPTRRQAMQLAHSLGLGLMVHIADPDTWFASHYRDARRYGSKPSHYEPFERAMQRYPDVPWLAAHMAGLPEHLEQLQRLLDRYPNLHLDTSATKWMVRELSKRPDELRDLLRRNPGRILWGTDLVVNAQQKQGPPMDDHYASRFWAMRTLFESDYHGPSPIVDPDLPLLDPALPPTSTATLAGCSLLPDDLNILYRSAAQRLGDQLHQHRTTHPKPVAAQP